MPSNGVSLMNAYCHRLQSRLQAVGSSGPRYLRGVTLVELLTVMVVLAVLTTISVGGYRRYLLKTNRTEATSALLRLQVAQEKFYLQNNTYTADLVALGLTAVTPTGHYQVAVVPPAGGLGVGYIATATAQGAQANDVSCRTMTINDRGQRASTPSAADICWH
jgi:type IV pilus assembly protein PilE